jgi:hypothetical protein
VLYLAEVTRTQIALKGEFTGVLELWPMRRDLES